MVATTDDDGPTGTEGPGSTPYQRLLRSVGSYLDLQDAAQIYVLETDEGFLVRYQTQAAPSSVISVRLGVGDLVTLDCRRQGRRAGHRQEVDGTDDGRYGDILRAMGYELEQVAACAIAVDEVDGSYTLTYHYTPAGSTTVRKHRTTIAQSGAEELLRRARARRRPAQRGWLRRPSGPTFGRVRIVALTQVDPCLERSPSRLYEYHLPPLSEGTVAALRVDGALPGDGPRLQQTPPIPMPSLDEMLLQPFEAARRISTVYLRCLDEVRLSGPGRDAVRKDQVVAAFARALTTNALLAAVKVVAQHIEGLRTLDAYEPGLGTNTVRWMQYLAAEVLDELEASTAGPFGMLPEQGELHASLLSIARSVSAADRFAAMRRVTSGR